MSREHRKALLSAYKEKKARPGIFAIRSASTGEAWVFSTPNLENRQNGFWFSLRLGSHPHRDLQAAWKATGEGDFRYEELETIDADGLTGWQLSERLKAREAHWRTTLAGGIAEP